MRADIYRRLTTTLRTLTIMTAILAGVAMGFLLHGSPRPALAAVILILFANVVSIETLRAAAALQSKEPR